MGRRKGTSAFPVARIKKMMQSDDDVGKIATVTPVLVAKALECMMEHVLREAAGVARGRHTRTVTPQHLKTCVEGNEHFDFLRPIVARVAGDEGVAATVGGGSGGRAKRPRSPAVRGARGEEAAGRKRRAVAVEDEPDAAAEDEPAAGVQQGPGVAEAVAGTGGGFGAEVGALQAAARGVDDDEEDYDDDDDKGDGGEEGEGGAGVRLPARQPPGVAGAGKERVSVHALLS